MKNIEFSSPEQSHFFNKNEILLNINNWSCNYARIKYNTIMKDIRKAAAREGSLLSTYSIIVVIVGTLFTLYMLFYLFRDPFKLLILFQKHIREFFFLILTGHFLYSLKYEIMGTPITFNALVIYISNSILKGYHFKGIELVYLFILFYFASQLAVYFINKEFSLLTLETILMRVLMWSILIYLFNRLTLLMTIDMTNIVDNLLFIPLIALLHFLVKMFFMTGERFLQRKYYNFFQHTLPYLVIDSILLYFAIIVGSVFNKIGLVSTALFISFLAIVLSLTNYISKREFADYQFYSIHSFFKAHALYLKGELFPFIPVYKKRTLKELLPVSIETLIFITIYSKETDFEKLELNRQNELLWGESTFFQPNKNSLTTVLINKDKAQLEELKMMLERVSGSPVTLACSFIERKNWDSINTNNIFRILLFELKKKKKGSDIIYIEQDYILL